MAMKQVKSMQVECKVIDRYYMNDEDIDFEQQFISCHAKFTTPMKVSIE